MHPKPPVNKKSSITNAHNKFSGELKFPYKHQHTTRQQKLPQNQENYQIPSQQFIPDPQPEPTSQSFLPIPDLQQQPIIYIPPPDPLPQKPTVIQQPFIYQPADPEPTRNLQKPIARKQPIACKQPVTPVVQQPTLYHQSPIYKKEPVMGAAPLKRQPLYPPTIGTEHYPQLLSYNPDVEQGDIELTPGQIEKNLVINDQFDQQDRSHEEEEREFMGGKKLYDRQLMQQPMYDEPTMQILNDTAADESFPVLVQYITQLSHLGRQAQARLIVRSASFQSKNQVLSNIQNLNDYMMAQDDFTYAQILSKADFSTYDMNADYFTAEAIMEAMFNIRLRRSKNALNLLQFNTQRQESIMGGRPQQEEEQKLRRKIPYLGQFLG